MEDFLHLGEIYNTMKNISILLVMCLIGTLCVERTENNNANVQNRSGQAGGN